MDFKSLAKEIIIDVEQFHVPDIDAKQHDLKSRFLKTIFLSNSEAFFSIPNITLISLQATATTIFFFYH